MCPWSILESPQEYHKCSHTRRLAPGIPMPVPLLGSILDVCCDSTERGVISGEAREQCISPLYRSPLLKVFPKSAASVSLIQNLQWYTSSSFFFFNGFYGGCSKIKVIFPVQQLFRVISVFPVSSFTLHFVYLLTFKTNFFLEGSQQLPHPDSPHTLCWRHLTNVQDVQTTDRPCILP